MKRKVWLNYEIQDLLNQQYYSSSYYLLYTLSLNTQSISVHIDIQNLDAGAGFEPTTFGL